MSFLRWFKELLEITAPEAPESEEYQDQPQSDEEIKNDPKFQKVLKELKPYYRWMTLAGGIDPIVWPFISFEKSESHSGIPRWKVTLEKHGYDLCTRSLIECRNATEPTEYKNALNRFAVDLFGKYAEEMRKVISFEYIADHLITVEDINRFSTEFDLTYSTFVYLSDWDALNLLRQEIETTTKIF